MLRAVRSASRFPSRGSLRPTPIFCRGYVSPESLTKAKTLFHFDPQFRHVDIFAYGDVLTRLFGFSSSALSSLPSLPISEPASCLPQPALHLARLPDPRLVSDFAAITQLPPITRDILLKLLLENPRLISFDGVTAFEDLTSEVWAPNIDTLLMCRALSNLRDRLNLVGARGLEVGCGSGFISEYLLSHNPGVEHMALLDVDPRAVNLAQSYLTASPVLRLGKSRQLSLHEGRAQDILDRIMAAGDQFDIVVCNPPYIPRAKTLAVENPYEGIALIQYLLKNRGRFLRPNGQLVLNLSSVCEDLVWDEVGSGSVELLFEREVPFKVFRVLNDPEWMEELKLGGGLRCQADAKDYPFWHTLRIFAFGNPK